MKAVLSFYCHQIALFWLNAVQMESKTVIVFILHLLMWLSEVPLQLVAQEHTDCDIIKQLVIISYWLVSGYLTRM